MMGAALVTAVTLVCRSLFGCYPSIKNFICLEFNLKALNKEKKKLIVLRGQLREDVDYLYDATMKKWLDDVEKILLEVDRVEAEYRKRCDVCLCYCCVREDCSQEIARVLKEVKRLLREGPIAAKMVNKDYLTKPVESIRGPSIKNQPTASTNLAKIVDLLNDPGVKRIGVWGMGGVGKTTLLKNLNKKLKDTQIFDVVILVTVSRSLDLKDVWRQIADRLNLEERDEYLAGRIRRQLVKQKFLLVLDDVWQTIDLDTLGVPSPEDSKLGSKIILTCRFLRVCMQMRTNVEVKVDVLNDEESWDLFIDTAGEVATSEQIEPIAKAVAEQCGGLPLALIVVGIAMRRQSDRRVWEDALSELKTSRDIPDIEDMASNVFNSLKWSYDFLSGDNNIKPCFLFCCLYPANFSMEIDELVKCWLGEGLLGEHRNYETSYNRGLTLIQSLKDSCLLEDGVREGTVKMHDIVRIFAIWISSSLEDGCKSMVQSGVDLTMIPESDLRTPVKRVSLMHNKITSLPDIQVDCAKSSTLLLQDNLELQTIDEGFFQAFKSLKVLNISGTGIGCLPKSICQLVDLLVLIMRDCVDLEEIWQIGMPRKLQVLDCSGSAIKSLPSGMKKLRQSYLSRTHQLKTIAPGVISAMSGLEVLDMTSSAYIWNAISDELTALCHLLVISMQLSRFPILDSRGKKWVDQLKRYQFVIGEYVTTSWQTGVDGKRVIITSGGLQGVSSGPLLSPATSVIIDHYAALETLQNMAVEDHDCFTALKFLTIANSSMLMSASESSSSSGVPNFELLPKLEKLHLINLNGLESISALMFRLGITLSRLRELEVTNCPGLEFLFSNNADTQNLEVLRIRFGGGLMKHIWRGFLQIQDPAVVFQKLRVLEVTSCKDLHHIPLSALNPLVLQEIRGHERWWENLEETDETKALFQHLFKPVNYEEI